VGVHEGGGGKMDKGGQREGVKKCQVFYGWPQSKGFQTVAKDDAKQYREYIRSSSDVNLSP